MASRWGAAPTELPRQTRNPPPASRALWETAQLGKRRREPPARFRGTLRPTPALGPAPGGDRCRRSPRQTRNPPPDTETPASLPGTLRDGPTGQTPPGNPPPDSGALCVRPLPSGRRRRRSAPGGDTAQRVRVVCRFEKVTYRCSPRIESFSARQLSATRSCTCWQISTRCSRAASSSSPRRSCLGRAICL